MRSYPGKKLMDVGGGCGIFSSGVLDRFPSMDITLVDPSEKLLAKADKRVHKVNGTLPNSLNVNGKFDYIHMHSVIHHLVGDSIKDSKNILKDSLLALRELLTDGGYLFLVDIFYDSYVLPSLTRTAIFYMLKAQKQLGIKIPHRAFLEGLEVCFYTRDELRSILEDSGYEIIAYREYPYRDSITRKALLLKGWGDMLYIAR
jgi:2-polyprenyl-3-methyl-5-hydroxy-6-metoxy-1,4-benzoquinol methylase